MIHEGTGSIFEVGADVIVNPVNKVGVMGKGVAKEVKDRFPWAFDDYRAYCLNKYFNRNHGLLSVMDGQPAIWHLPTKDHWGDGSSIQMVRNGAFYLAKSLRDKDLDIYPRIVAVPALGCGLGGLRWEEVLPVLWEAFSGIEGIDILLFPPKG